MNQPLSAPNDGSVGPDSLLTFHMNGEEYSNDILAVQDGLSCPQSIHGCPAHVRGLINLRREAASVVCLPGTLLSEQDL